MYWIMLIILSILLGLSPAVQLLNSNQNTSMAGYVLFYVTIPAGLALFIGGFIGRTSFYWFP